MTARMILAGFDRQALDLSRSSIALIDPDATIRWVNAAWRRRGSAYGVGADPTGTSYLNAIGPSLRGHFEDLLGEALRSGKVFEIDYECPSPEEHRTFRLRGSPLDRAGILLEHTLVVARPATDERPSPPPHDAYLNPDRVLVQCANCRRVHHPGEDAWHFVPALLGSSLHPVSHGLCPTCEGYYWGRRVRVRASKK